MELIRPVDGAKTGAAHDAPPRDDAGARAAEPFTTRALAKVLRESLAPC